MFKRNKSILVAFASVILAFLLSVPMAFATKQDNDDKRQAVMAEFLTFKHDYLKKELNLSKAQETPFFKVYDQMTEELFRVGKETRELERKVINNPDASETELESAARTIFEQKKKEGEIELKYFDEFKEILDVHQLIKLKEVERRMLRQLMKHQSTPASAPRRDRNKNKED